MNLHFGIESHSDPLDHDDGTDDFIIGKYRAQIEGVEAPPRVSISAGYSLDELELPRHIEELSILTLAENDAIQHKIRRNSLAHEQALESLGESDNSSPRSDTVTMNDITREELDAKLDATNARLEARLSSFEGAIRETLAAVRQDSAEMRGELKVMHGDLGDLKNIKGSIWGAAGATIIGVGGILAAMLSFGVASFDTGRETSQLVEAAKQQTLDTKKLLEQIQSQQKLFTPPPVTPPPSSSK